MYDYSGTICLLACCTIVNTLAIVMIMIVTIL